MNEYQLNKLRSFFPTPSPLNILSEAFRNWRLAIDEEVVQGIELFLGTPEAREALVELQTHGAGVLADAIENSFPRSTIHALIEAGADPDVPSLHGRWGNTSTYPIHVAIKRPEILDLVLSAGAKLDTLSDDLRLPLDVALRTSGTEGVSKEQHPAWQLLAAGADPNRLHGGRDGLSQNMQDKLQRKGLHSLKQPLILRALQTEHVGWLAEHGGDLLAKDKTERTLLHKESDVEMVELALAAGLDPNSRDIWGNTPAHFQSNEASLRALVNGGGNLNARNEDGNTPLHTADSAEVILALLAAGANPLATDGYGKTPLQVLKDRRGWEHIAGGLTKEATAAMKGKPRTVKELSALVRKIEDGNIAAVKTAIAGGLDPNTFHEGRPLYMYALQHNVQLEMVDLLIDAGADLSNTGHAWHGGGFLHELAVRPNATEAIAKYASRCDLAHTDNFGKSPLGLVAERMPEKDSSGQDYRVSNCQALLEAGVVPTEADIIMARTMALRILLKRACAETGPRQPTRNVVYRR